jgi:hypothetical protein
MQRVFTNAKPPSCNPCNPNTLQPTTMIRVHDRVGDVIETHAPAGRFQRVGKGLLIDVHRHYQSGLQPSSALNQVN